jgi:hypothetical protein
MENKITVEISKNHTVELFQENTEYNCYELVFTEGEELGIRELKALNQAGFVYNSSITDIDYEDEDTDGSIVCKYMDVHYFAKAHSNIFENCIPA